MASTTTALGGSASSQAETLDRAAWTPRPLTAFALKLTLFLAPILAAVLAVRGFIAAVSAPNGTLLYWVWMAALVAVSCAVSVGMQRVLRRLAPLTVLLKMSLVFPDEAPDRFGLALRSGTFRSLSRKVSGPNDLRSDDQARAEHLVEAMGQLGRHDRMTTGHSERVRAYAVMLGEEIGLSADELDKLNWAALVHDIGKLAVPSEILNKPGRPTADEWAVLREHPGAGYHHVNPLRPWLGDWVDAATQHHERWDGGGYPLGLAGTDISIAGRIVAIADAFDVMTATRSYKKPLAPEQARAELTLNSGTQFDPHLVRSFLQISLGRMRRAIGPLGLLGNFPDLIRVPLTVALTSTTAVVTAAAIAAGASAGAIAPRTISEPAAVEQSIEIDSAPANQVPRSGGGTNPDGTRLTAVPGDTIDASGATAPADPLTDEALVSTVVPVIEESPTESILPPISTPDDPAVPSVTTALPTTKPPAITTPPTTTKTTTPPTTPPTTTKVTAPPSTAPPTTVDTSPVADDTATALSGARVNIKVLQNDGFPGATIDFKTLAVLIAPANGTVKVIAGQNLLYQSNVGFRGNDTMTYQVCSTLGACDTAVVTVTVT